MSDGEEDQLLAIFGRVSLYKDKDKSAPTEPCCKVCHCTETPSSSTSKKKKKLPRCSFCRCVEYCGRQCQKIDWPQHKPICRMIQMVQRVIEMETYKVEHHVVDGQPVNLFETEAGNFMHMTVPNDYVMAMFDLSETLYRYAYQTESMNLWEKLLHHYQKLLYLCPDEIMGLKTRVPFVLLFLNRDDDAYAFCRYFTNDQDYEDYRTPEEEYRTYPSEEGCRYLDIFEQCPDDIRFMPLSYLVAVSLVKLKLVAAYDAKIQVGESVSEEETDKVEANRQQVQRLLDFIHDKNPSMLPAILNPTPLTSQPLPSVVMGANAAEAYIVLTYAGRAWLRIPGAEEMLLERFGSNPVYDDNLDPHGFLRPGSNRPYET